MDNKLYLNIWNYDDPAYPFQIFMGSRGAGKTYSGLSGCYARWREYNEDFIYMRRTAEQLKTIMDTSNGQEGLNPFKTLNDDKGWNVGLKSINGKAAGIFNREWNGERFLYSDPIGYGLALSTVASIRGIDASNCRTWIYDEFIPEKHEKILRGEADAVFNAYESFNRNREFKGLPPMRLWMLSNSNDIYNPIIKGLGLVHDCEKMVRQGIEHKYYPERALAVHIFIPLQEFRDAKSKTALYRLTAGTEFADMALDNKFAYNDFSLIGYKKISGYSPICGLDKGYFYRKKGERKIHCCYAKAPVRHFDSKNAHDILAFKRSFAIELSDMFPTGDLTFESYELKANFVNLILGAIV